MGDLETVIFNIIAHAGEAKNFSMQAIDASITGDKEASDNLLSQANESLKQAGNYHFKLITGKVEIKELSLLLIHAEDQLITAETFRDLAVKLIATNMELAQLKEKLVSN